MEQFPERENVGQGYSKVAQPRPVSSDRSCGELVLPLGKAHRKLSGARSLWMFWRAYLMILMARRLLERKGLKDSQRMLLRHWKTSYKDLSADDWLICAVENAVAAACRWQVRETLCFPRAVAAYSLLRGAGAKPILYIGIRAQPFEAHAWVEANGIAVGDSMMAQERQHLKIISSYPDKRFYVSKSQLS